MIQKTANPHTIEAGIDNILIKLLSACQSFFKPCPNYSCTKVTNLVCLSFIAFSDPKKIGPLFFLPSLLTVCPWRITLPALSLSLWSISHLPPLIPVLASLITKLFPYKSFLRTNPKYIPACQKNSLCTARWELCTVTLCYPPALFSPVSASPITQSHTHSLKHIQLRSTQACIHRHSLVWTPECYCKPG